MSPAHFLRHSLTMSPRQVAAKALRYAGRVVGNRLVGRLMRGQCTYPPFVQLTGMLERRLPQLDRAALEANGEALRKLAQATLAHRFDLLGSGWVAVAHGARHGGFGPHRYGPGPKLSGNWRDAVAAQHWPGNRGRARCLLDMIEDGRYQPIDWHVDFKSGYRWSPRTFGAGVAYGHRPGVDVKVPWELARLQHLPPLALAFALDADPRLAAEFRHQVLDFLGSNPPGWGVNWACAMDVAIRAANILMAWDLFRAHGAAFDQDFEEELTLAMLAHARHVAGRLEWSESHRGNHYLADLCGLAWTAAYLPRTEETDIFLVFATRQLAAEVERQFGADGGNFEASTAYHRLSAEMALYTVALILGLPESRRAAFAEYDHKKWPHKPELAAGPLAWPPFRSATLERLARAARFAADVTKPSGEIVQIGDNDSGRFFKLAPRFDDAMREAVLDPGHLLAAAAGLFDLDLPAPPVAAVETALVAALAGGVRPRIAVDPARRLDGDGPADAATKVVRVVISPADASALDGLRAVAYPDFGLFIWRNARAFVSVRCGPIGCNGLGAHAHNDQLAVEVEIDGVPFARDPGTFVYTPDLAARNRYRSALAHFVPRHGDAEPARLDLGPFRLEDRARAQALRFAEGEFLGCHHGFPVPVWRRVLVGDGAVVVEDCWGGAAIGRQTAVEEHRVATPAELARLWGLDLPFSPGYGRTR